MDNIKLVLTNDGSFTLFNERINEHFHSIHGAVGESRHIFINAGLLQLANTLKEIRILEIGFGTGLNALLTLVESRKLNIKVKYTALEPYPISSQIVERLDYCKYLSVPLLEDSFKSFHISANDKVVAINDHFIFTRHQTTFQQFEPGDDKYDLVYFDAFSPDIEPTLWTADVFNKLHAIMSRGGLLVTYCCKGVVRRQMQSSNFMTERLPGPPGKRHILRATSL